MVSPSSAVMAWSLKVFASATPPLPPGEPLLVVEEDELLPQPLSNSAALMPSAGKSFWSITILFIGVYDTEYTERARPLEV